MEMDLNLLVVLIPIIATAIVQIIVALKTSSKLDVVSAKADVITGHVNSAATAANSKIEAMGNEISALKRLLSDDKERAALLAQTAAVTQASSLRPTRSSDVEKKKDSTDMIVETMKVDTLNVDKKK